MDSQIEHVFLLSTVSNSELFLVKEGQEDISNFEIVTRPPMLKFQSECHDNDSKSSQPHFQARKEENKEEGEEEHCDRMPESKQPEASNPDEEDDGFRTPTSLEHKIPEAKQCPPAPRKPKPSLKRKASSCSCRRHPLEFSEEVELLFQTQYNPLSDSYQSTKKVRREDPK